MRSLPELAWLRRGRCHPRYGRRTSWLGGAPAAARALLGAVSDGCPVRVCPGGVPWCWERYRVCSVSVGCVVCACVRACAWSNVRVGVAPNTVVSGRGVPCGGVCVSCACGLSHAVFVLAGARVRGGHWVAASRELGEHCLHLPASAVALGLAARPPRRWQRWRLRRATPRALRRRSAERLAAAAASMLATELCLGGGDSGGFATPRSALSDGAWPCAG